MHYKFIAPVKVLVFKTNLRNPIAVGQLKPSLDSHPGIIKWNVDLQDVDHVLRIESRFVRTAEVISLVTGEGFYCEELPD